LAPWFGDLEDVNCPPSHTVRYQRREVGESIRNMIDRIVLTAFAAKLAPALAGVAFIAIVSSELNPSVYARFSLLFSAANLIGVLSVSWIAQSILRFFPGDRNAGPMAWRVFLVGLALSAALASACGILVAVFGWHDMRPQSWPLGLMFTALTTSLAGNSIASASAASAGTFHWLRNAEILRGLALIGFSLVATQLAPAVEGALAAYSAATLIPSILLAVSLRRLSDPGYSGQEQLSEVLHKFFRFGWPITIWSAMQASQSFMERTVLAMHIPEHELGDFLSVADIMVRGIGLILMPIVIVIHPRLMAGKSVGASLDGAGRVLLRSSLVALALGSVIALGAVIAIRPIAAIAMPAFASASLANVVLLAVAGSLWPCALLVHKPLEVRGATMSMAICLGLTIPIQFAVLAGGVSYFGVNVMPLASIIAATIYMLACTFLDRGTQTSL
jgi:hypothetical protein